MPYDLPGVRHAPTHERFSAKIKSDDFQKNCLTKSSPARASCASDGWKFLLELAFIQLNKRFNLLSAEPFSRNNRDVPNKPDGV
jgi:hypothetical protein